MIVDPGWLDALYQLETEIRHLIWSLAIWLMIALGIIFLMVRGN